MNAADVQRGAVLARACIDAALANADVQAFVAERLVTWSEERVRRNPPVRVLFELGEVRGDLGDLHDCIRHGAKSLGAVLGVEPLRPEDQIHPYCIAVLRAPNHPRRIRYERRMRMKRMLGPDRSVVTAAARRRLQEFVTWGESQAGLAGRVQDRLGISLADLWRATRGKDVELAGQLDLALT